MDPSQVDQILVNLSVNARDAIMNVGMLTIETFNVIIDETYCHTHAGFIPGAYVLLAVSDNGAGMEQETLSRLFEPFFTTKERGKGTGLGLATVYGIVKQNQGFINIYSEPERGSTFKVYLPREQTDISTEVISDEQLVIHGFETLLLVEDDSAILNLAKGILEHQGYTVLAAQTPGSALTLLEQHDAPVHLLITDVVMPEMNGKDLQKKITALAPGIKTLFMSGYTADVIVHHGILDTEIHFLQKPFSIRTLMRKVREVLDADEGRD
jgi:CheY-like chemotaxis protein